MPQIALTDIDPNPFRDFDLHPIDQKQVQRLMASIGADGFWSSVVARKSGDRYQLAFGHHRIAAARGAKLERVPIEVRKLSDWQMVRMLASENATQRGTTAAASLDAVAAISRQLVGEFMGPVEISTGVLSRDQAEAIRANLCRGEGPGWRCIQAVMPAGAFTQPQIVNALGVLKDSAWMAKIIAAAAGTNESAALPTFDANCAHLFKRDYHLSEFRRIVTDQTVLSYLPVSQQVDFAQKIIAAIGATEMTAVRLRERANIIFYEELGVPRAGMRGSRLRISDDRIRDALNMMRRGTHDIERSCKLVADLIAEGVDVSPEVVTKFAEYIKEIDTALKSVVPKQTNKRSNLRLIVDKREEVA